MRLRTTVTHKSGRPQRTEVSDDNNYTTRDYWLAVDRARKTNPEADYHVTKIELLNGDDVVETSSGINGPSPLGLGPQ